MLINNNILKIVIVGAGAAGIKLSKYLGNYKYNNKYYKIILVDKNLFYTWKPLLHIMDYKNINKYINKINYYDFSKENNLEFELGKLINIDRKNKKILLDDVYSKDSDLIIKKRYIYYDYLILSIGGETNDYNINGVKENCIRINNINDSNLCLSKINNLFIKQIYSLNKNDIFNIIVVGAGPTGIELSSEIVNIILNYNKNNFYKIDINRIKVILIESCNTILPTFSFKFVSNVFNELNKIGINILLNTKISKVIKEGIYTNDKSFIKGDIIIWTTGIKINDYIKNISDLEINNINQFIVRENLTTSKDFNIFAIGDCCECYINNIKIPPRAQSANQMADFLFKNIKLLLKNKKINNFIYKDKGTLINLSKFNTFGIININFINKKIFIKGFLAKILYIYLYRSYQISIYGFFKTILIIITEYFLKILKIY